VPKMAIVKEEKKESEEQERYSVEDVTTATEPRIYDGEKTHTLEEGIVIILNKLDKIEKNIVG